MGWHSSYKHTHMDTWVTPEQQKAYEVLVDNLLVESDSMYGSSFGDMFPTDFVAFSRTPFNNQTLPKGKDWVWNQSSGKCTLSISDDETVCFYKMNVRKRRGCALPPSYKIWVYILFENNHESRYFLWCEKGEGSSRTFAAPKSSNTIPLEFFKLFSHPTFPSFPRLSFDSCALDLDIDDLKFLQPYMSEITATELGWL